MPQVELDQRYREELKGKMIRPREEFENQINMSDEEKEHRQVFFENLFSQHDSTT